MFTVLLSPSHRLLIKAGLVVSSLMVLSPGYAATQCVNSAPLLLSTLFLGQTATEPLTIKLVKGTYLMTNNIAFLMAQPFAIEGGYNADCTVQTVDAANTVIDMGNKYVELDQHKGDPIAEARIEALTVRNALKFALRAGAFNAWGANDEGQAVMRNVRLTQIGGAGNTSWPIDIYAINAQVVMDNVVLDHLEASGDCAVYIYGEGGAGAHINHLTADLWSGDDFCIDANEDPANHSIYNSILDSSNGGQPHFKVSLITIPVPIPPLHLSIT